MSRRTLPLAAALCICSALGSPAPAATVYLEMYPLTGELRLANPSAAAFSFTFYSISAANPALDGSPAVWQSISDDYDVSGNGFIDPLNNWTKFATGSTQLAEGVFLGPGGSLPAFRSVRLGEVWNGSTSLTAQVVQADSQFATVNLRMAIDGDYNWDESVDGADYTFWKSRYGQSGTIGGLQADGNLNGVVDAADYTIWRNNSGLELPGAGAGSSAGDGLPGFVRIGGFVPEPSAAVLLLVAGGALAAVRRRMVSRVKTH
jgi:hypothetical protein